MGRFTPRTIMEYYTAEGEAGHHQKSLYSAMSPKRFHKRARILKEFMLRIEGLNKALCVDIGCAEGWHTSWIGERARFVIGVDISRPKLVRAMQESNTEKTSYILVDWDHLPFPDSTIDIAQFSEGPEHSLEPKVTIKEIQRILKEGGYLILSSPIGSTERSAGDPFDKPFHGHIQEFSPSSIIELVSEDFEVVGSFLPSGYGSKRAWLTTKYSSLIVLIRHFVVDRMHLDSEKIPYVLRRFAYAPLPDRFGVLLCQKRTKS